MQIIAMVSMLVDHLGIAFFKGDDAWRIIGRLALPLYAYGIVQGYRHTSNVKRYFVRLAALAALSQLPFMLALNLLEVNVIGTFIVCLSVLIGLNYIRDKLPGLVHKLAGVLIVAAAASLLELIPFDYGAYALLLILAFRYLKGWQWIAAHMALNLIFLVYKLWVLQLASIIPTVWLVYYPQMFAAMGRIKVPRWMWRSFYPAHLFVLAVVVQLYTR